MRHCFDTELLGKRGTENRRLIKAVAHDVGVLNRCALSDDRAGSYYAVGNLLDVQDRSIAQKGVFDPAVEDFGSWKIHVFGKGGNKLVVGIKAGMLMREVDVGLVEGLYRDLFPVAVEKVGISAAPLDDFGNEIPGQNRVLEGL